MINWNVKYKFGFDGLEIMRVIFIFETKNEGGSITPSLQDKLVRLLG
jgi:hypothetical protein